MRKHIKQFQVDQYRAADKRLHEAARLAKIIWGLPIGYRSLRY